MDKSLHRHLTRWHFQTDSGFRFAFCSFFDTPVVFFPLQQSVNPSHYYHYNTLSLALRGSFSGFLFFSFSWAVSPLCLSHPALPLSCSDCSVILFGRSLSPLSRRTEAKSSPSHLDVSLSFHLCFSLKHSTVAVVNLSTHFASCHTFSYFKRIPAKPFCVWINWARSPVLFSLAYKFMDYGFPFFSRPLTASFYFLLCCFELVHLIIIICYYYNYI